MRADYHGAYISVVHSKIDSYIGLEGIIINESLKTFKVINKENRILTLLKNEMIVQFQVGEKYYLVNTNNLIYRSTDRTKVKFKSKKPEEMNLTFLEHFVHDSEQ